MGKFPVLPPIPLLLPLLDLAGADMKMSGAPLIMEPLGTSIERTGL